ncbi:PIN domain-containing protein [Herbiconiux moechotypicola]|nr:PIN domain-containing protein [Herbiconiux moechotypicola]MCS5729196.1 PIN domain-containing protein [Herbiconiux moechotypicola]
MDVLLTLCEDLHFTWVWTDEILEEWEIVIVREGMRSRESARSVTDVVREHFGQHRLDPALYRDKAAEDLSPDPDDRVHVAACLYGDVDVMLTRDVKHFRGVALDAAQVEVQTADAFLCRLLGRHGHGVAESFARAASAKENPSTTPEHLAIAIARAGAPVFAERITAKFAGGVRGRRG